MEMKTFVVRIDHRSFVTGSIEVKAESAEQAKKLIENGSICMGDISWSYDGLDDNSSPSIFQVNEVKFC